MGGELLCVERVDTTDPECGIRRLLDHIIEFLGVDVLMTPELSRTAAKGGLMEGLPHPTIVLPPGLDEHAQNCVLSRAVDTLLCLAATSEVARALADALN